MNRDDIIIFVILLFGIISTAVSPNVYFTKFIGVMGWFIASMMTLAIMKLRSRK